MSDLPTSENMSELEHDLAKGKVLKSGEIDGHSYQVIRTDEDRFISRNYQAYEHVAYVDGELIATSSDLREQNPEQIWPVGLENRAIGYIHGVEGSTSAPYPSKKE